MELKSISAHELPVNALALANVHHNGEMRNRVVRRVDDSIREVRGSGLPCVLLVDATVVGAQPFRYMKDNSVYPLPVEIDEVHGNAFPDDEEDACKRCNNLLDENGLCTDQTCPFSDHAQDCVMGWSGHPDYPQDIAKCTCTGHPGPKAPTLDEKRRAVLEDFYTNADLLGFQVEDADGWETVWPGDEYHRNIYVEPEVPSEDNGSIKKILSVTFATGEAKIVSASLNGEKLDV